MSISIKGEECSMRRLPAGGHFLVSN